METRAEEESQEYLGLHCRASRPPLPGQTFPASFQGRTAGDTTSSDLHRAQGLASAVCQRALSPVLTVQGLFYLFLNAGSFLTLWSSLLPNKNDQTSGLGPLLTPSLLVPNRSEERSALWG